MVMDYCYDPIMPYFKITREDLDLPQNQVSNVGKQLDAPRKNWLTFAKWTGWLRSSAPVASVCLNSSPFCLAQT